MELNLPVLLFDPAAARAEYCLDEILSANLVDAAIPATTSTCSSEFTDTSDRCTKYQFDLTKVNAL